MSVRPKSTGNGTSHANGGKNGPRIDSVLRLGVQNLALSSRGARIGAPGEEEYPNMTKLKELKELHKLYEKGDKVLAHLKNESRMELEWLKSTLNGAEEGSDKGSDEGYKAANSRLWVLEHPTLPRAPVPNAIYLEWVRQRVNSQYAEWLAQFRLQLSETAGPSKRSKQGH